MDDVESLFDACLGDRVDDVTARVQRDNALVHSRRIGGRTPLHQAAFGGAVRAATVLIEAGADVNAASEYGWVPLHYAAAPESPAVAELLVRHGADVNAVNGDGRTPLHQAADFGKRDVVALLLAHGADPNVRDGDGQRPADYAPPDSEVGELLGGGGAPHAGANPAGPASPTPEWLGEGERLLIDGLAGRVDSQWHAGDKGPASRGPADG